MEIPAHIPRDLVKPYPFIRGCWTYDDPFKTLVPKIHEEMPDIFYSTEAIPGRRPAWILRRAADLRAVYLDTDHFSNKAFSRGEMIGEHWSNVPSETDPPLHGKYRAALNPLFSPRRMRELEEPVRRYAREYIAKFKHRGSCDFLADFAFRFPIAVFLDLMGLPQDQLETFLEWEHSLLHEPDLSKMAAATRVVVAYLRGRIDACRRTPGTDFISIAVAAEVDGRKLTEDEVVGLCFNLFIGGLDTVSTNIGLHFRHLAETPAHQQHLRADPAFIPVAVEELLRAFAAVTTLRVCTQETIVKGVTFKAGDKVAMSTTLGNNDPAQYERPGEVIFGRKGSGNTLTFAHGVHRCVGAHLARREIIIAMEEFLAAIPEFRIEPGTKIRTRLGTIIQPESLPLAWTNQGRLLPIHDCTAQGDQIVMNKQIRLKRRPEGLVKAEDFETVVAAAPQLQDGEILVKTIYLSIDVPIRLLLEHDIPLDGGMFLPKTEIGNVVTAFGNGKVIQSRHPDFPVGSYVGGLMGLQEYNVVKQNPFNHKLPPGVALDVALNGLGNTGMTAYFGLYDLGKPKPGDTVLVSAAAGSIGVIVCQLARNLGCKVIGLAGSDDKVRWLIDEVGIDGAINYKTEQLDTRLRELCPQKINLYYDIVGGDILDIVLGHMANHSRVVACGTMGEGPPGSWKGIHKLYSSLLSKRIAILGLNASDFIKRYADAGKELMAMSMQGKLRWFNTVVEGLDQAPSAINALYTGGNKGKLLLKVADD